MSERQHRAHRCHYCGNTGIGTKLRTARVYTSAGFSRVYECRSRTVCSVLAQRPQMTEAQKQQHPLTRLLRYVDVTERRERRTRERKGEAA